MSKPILSLDFDGVIHNYHSGWQGPTVIADPPTPGALRWMVQALEWWDIHIYSTRSKDSNAVKAMRNWLTKHAQAELEPHEVLLLTSQVKFAHEKPWAFLTIDDRAIRFEGDWSKLDPKALLNFKPWNKDKGWTPPT